MRRLLHIFTDEAPLGRELAERQRALPDVAVEVVDLTQTAPDYDALLDRIFEADSIASW